MNKIFFFSFLWKIFILNNQALVHFLIILRIFVKNLLKYKNLLSFDAFAIFNRRFLYQTKTQIG